MHRFYIDVSSLGKGSVVFPKNTAHQIHKVLRLHPKERVVVFDNSGRECDVVPIRVTREEVVGEVVQRRPGYNEPAIEIVLFQSLLKKDKFERVLQKCTEVSVARFAPIVTQGTVIPKPSSNKMERWQRIIIDAAEQSRRHRLPILNHPVPFEEAIRGLEEYDLALIPWINETTRNLHGLISELHRRQIKRIAYIIGPEGGFTTDEANLATEYGSVPVTLGPRTFRSETAAIVTAALILCRYGEMSLRDSS